MRIGHYSIVVTARAVGGRGGSGFPVQNVSISQPSLEYRFGVLQEMNWPSGLVYVFAVKIPVPSEELVHPLFPFRRIY